MSDKSISARAGIAGFLGAALFAALYHSGPAVAQLGSSLPAFVRLQAASPGTQQAGHLNISGSGLFGSKVAIGNSLAPFGALTIRHDDARQIALQRAGQEGWMVGITTNGSDGLTFLNEADGLSRLFLAEDGSVGIGTDSPSEKLTISGGKVYASGLGPGTGLQFAGSQIYEDFGRDLRFTTNGGNATFADAARLGVRTLHPQAELHVAGNLVLDSTSGSSGPVLYTGVGPSELNRYLNLINSPDLTNASGLKAGGVLVAESYDWGQPGKNDLLVKGRVGIGHNAPPDPLTVEGLVSSTSGGFKFPDGSVQLRAASGTGFFNVKDFGAKGDNSANDTPAVNDAISALTSRGGGTLYFPAGVYRLSSRLDISTPLRIAGEGRQLSRLRWTSSQGGVRFEGGGQFEDGRAVCQVMDLTFITEVANGGDALSVSYTTPPGAGSRFVEIERCEFTNAQGSFWNREVVLRDVRDSRISGCEFRSPFNNSYAATVGIDIDAPEEYHPTLLSVSDCNFFYNELGIRVRGDFEGLSIDTSIFLACNRGIDWDTRTGHPELAVVNCFFDIYTNGVNVVNCTDSKIVNCGFIVGRNSPSFSHFVGVFGESFNVRVSENYFRNYLGFGNGNGVIVGGDAEYVRVDANNFANILGTCIWLNPGALRCVVLDNDMRASTGNHIIDIDTIDTIKRKIHGP